MLNIWQPSSCQWIYEKEALKTVSSEGAESPTPTEQFFAPAKITTKISSDCTFTELEKITDYKRIDHPMYSNTKLSYIKKTKKVRNTPPSSGSYAHLLQY